MDLTDSGLEAQFTLERSKTGIVEEPPFRILVLGDWSGDGKREPLAERRPKEIDRDNFDDVLRRFGTALDLEMDGGGSLHLEFNELDDFHPDQIFRNVSILGELRELRKRLNSEDTFYSAAREVRERFDAREPADHRQVEGSSTEAVGEPADDLLDAILMKPSGGGAAPKTKASGELETLVADLVRPHLVSVDESERSGYVSAVDKATSALMRSILHNKRFQELESAWRGLYFLVRRSETSTDLKLYLLDITKDELTDNLRSANSLAETVLYRHLIKDAVETPGAEPWALTLGNYSFSPDVDDVATLMRVSKIAAVANAPFISHMRPDVLGVHSLAEDPDPSQWKISPDNNAAKLWSALCDQTESVYLGMTIPRFLSRLPYGADTDPLETFSFEEFVDAPVHDHYVWSNSAFITGQLLAASYSAYGWEMGRNLLQDAEGLPTHIYKEGTETVFKPCGEVLLTDNAVNVLMDRGLMPLVSYKNTDKVKLAQFQSIAGTALKGMWS